MKKILIISNENKTSYLIKQGLKYEKKEENKITIINDGLIAVNSIQNNHYDIIILETKIKNIIFTEILDLINSLNINPVIILISHVPIAHLLYFFTLKKYKIDNIIDKWMFENTFWDLIENIKNYL